MEGISERLGRSLMPTLKKKLIFCRRPHTYETGEGAQSTLEWDVVNGEPVVGGKFKGRLIAVDLARS